MSSRMKLTGLVLLLLASVAPPGAAQERPARWTQRGEMLAPSHPTASIIHPSTAGMAAAGLAGGALGLLGGGLLGYALATGGSCSGEWDCGLGPRLLGGLIGESVLLATGVHLASGGHGSVRRSALYSMAIAAGGIVVAGATAVVIPEFGLGVLLAVPAVQIAASIGEERSARRRSVPPVAPEPTTSR